MKSKDMLYIQDFSILKDNQFFHGENLICKLSPETDLKTFTKTCYSKLEMDYPKFHKMDGLCKLGILASEVLFKSNKIPKNTALVFANNASSLDTDEKHRANLDLPSPGIFVYTLPNIVMGEISIRHGLKSENAFFVSEKFDRELLVDYSKILVQSHPEASGAESVICGWIDLYNQNFEVFLFLVSKKGNIPFTEENLNTLYKNPME